MPLSATPFAVVTMDIDIANNALIMATTVYQKGSFKLYGKRVVSSNNLVWGHWISICR